MNKTLITTAIIIMSFYGCSDQENVREFHDLIYRYNNQLNEKNELDFKSLKSKSVIYSNQKKISVFGTYENYLDELSKIFDMLEDSPESINIDQVNKNYKSLMDDIELKELRNLAINDTRRELFIYYEYQISKKEFSNYPEESISEFRFVLLQVKRCIIDYLEQIIIPIIPYFTFSHLTIFTNLEKRSFNRNEKIKLEIGLAGYNPDIKTFVLLGDYSRDSLGNYTWFSVPDTVFITDASLELPHTFSFDNPGKKNISGVYVLPFNKNYNSEFPFTEEIHIK